MADVFSERFVPLRAEVGELDRDATQLTEGLHALFEATEVPDSSASMRRYREIVVGGDGGLAGELRAAIVEHARAWNVVLAACGTMPNAA